MERARSVSSSSSDSWSLLEEADENEELSVDEHERAEQREQREQSQLQNDAKQHSPLGQMDSLESITSVGLPLDLSPALLSQHLLVVSTPASSSIVTHTGAILSPEQSAQALANVDSPVLISPPKSPPIESTFTFLKDPRVRISFSDSYESKEGEQEEQAKKPGVEKAVDEVADEAEAEDEVFGPIVEPPNGMVEEAVDQAVLGQSDIQEVDVAMEEEIGRSKEAIYGSEAEAEEKPQVKDEELTVLATLIDGSDSSELESIANGLDSISSQAEYSSGSGDLSLEMDTEEEEEAEEEFKQDTEDVVMKEEEDLAMNEEENVANMAKEDVAKLEEDVANLEKTVAMEEEGVAKKEEEAVYEVNLAAKKMEYELSNTIHTPAFTASSLDVSLNAENCTIPSLPSATPSPPSHAIVVHANVDNLAESDGVISSGTENAGWTELSISMSSSNSEEQLLLENEAEIGTNDQESAIDTAQLVAQRLDELSNETEESLWQRLLDETFCSLKSFERSDRIINILIIAMFLTSISSMTILHILENTWMASNFSSMPPHFRAAIAASKMPQYPPPGPPGFPSCFQGAKELQWPQRKTLKEQQMGGKEENSQEELEQYKHELVETKVAYESKAKILHYIRMKELEQEMLLNELKRQLDEAKMVLEQYKPKDDEEKLLNGYNPFTPKLRLALMEAMGMEEKLQEEKATERRSRKRRAMLNLLEMEQHQQGDTIHGSDVEEEEAEEPFASQQPTLLPPFYWPGPEQLGQLVAPPASIDSHLTAPPVSSNSKGKVPESVGEEGTDLDEPHEVPRHEMEEAENFWPSHFLHYFDQESSTSGTSDSEADEADSEAEEAEEASSPPKKHAKMELIEMADQEGFGQLFAYWRKYNKILVNLSTQSGRNHVLKSVKNAVVTRLNRTIEKTTTALAAATKMVTAENFGQNLFTSTVKEVMARVENSATGLSAIVDCLNTGLQLVQQNIQFCGTQTDWEEEEEAKENEAKEGEEAGKNGQVDEVEGSLRSGQWLLQRATARAALRHQATGHGSHLHMNLTLRLGRARFTGWFFARAILREKQRVDQDNGTAESETRFSLLQDDWMYARQKARARLREKELKPRPDEAEAEVVFNEQQKDWFFIRQKLRAKARQKGSGNHQRHRNEEGWLFSRQKLRQKLREQGQKHGEHVNDDFWATERGKSKKWRRKAHKKWKGAAKWASNANNYGNNHNNLAGDEWDEEED